MILQNGFYFLILKREGSKQHTFWNQGRFKSTKDQGGT